MRFDQKRNNLMMMTWTCIRLFGRVLSVLAAAFVLSSMYGGDAAAAGDDSELIRAAVERLRSEGVEPTAADLNRAMLDILAARQAGERREEFVCDRLDLEELQVAASSGQCVDELFAMLALVEPAAAPFQSIYQLCENDTCGQPSQTASGGGGGGGGGNGGNGGNGGGGGPGGDSGPGNGNGNEGNLGNGGGNVRGPGQGAGGPGTGNGGENNGNGGDTGGFGNP